MAPKPTPRKRQNIITADQAPITSFFKPAEKLRPELPEAIQSSLISVGMRVRKSVPEGYKSGSYAYNKHLPDVGGAPLTPPSESEMFSSQESNVSSLDASTTTTATANKKRALDYDDEKVAIDTIRPVQHAPASINQWARTVKAATKGALGGKKNRGFHQAVPRKDIKMTGAEDFEEADFLKPVDAMEK
ncbi:hypothetical protein FPQ18DRAFT_314632 [Pyronema domesticum]|uniref:Similar to S-phase delaying protein 1 acc. no. Q10585 n=1 Tax=Pyronema omphalodes (strain CBS 100304) TaxID=1076935 RepID=U4KZS6_PYROM|nr:hypothetical protein FPQ18DRAFT_314632 [Pyronema domesticum]CCX08020.1 Similar to S-phase delaying protein 1; acc. no. Q10585 [Pyronema omphalodes CBS 100304]